jgi:hypothetical protein
MKHPRRVALPLVAASFLPAACTKKAEPPPVAQQAPATTAPAPTTLPASPSPVPSPTPPAVWREARWGMTRAQVMAAFPREAQRGKPAGFAQPQHDSMLPAGVSDLSIPAYEADGATFCVLFGFEKNALNRVHLTALKPGPATCSDLEKALSERYSAPDQRRATGASLKGEEVVWRRPDQTVVLGCAGVASLGFVTVTLDHLAPAAGAGAGAN